ncbi:unnamed protein product [Trichogramma brassicae]|uniref:Glycoprotein n=1 Tax=Trichogramma brassicae TaxID=86971 RepID=A0A6H5IWQ7_9HYME|nr:unnamed protein product [Trichogramma brassicae]
MLSNEWNDELWMIIDDIKDTVEQFNDLKSEEHEKATELMKTTRHLEVQKFECMIDFRPDDAAMIARCFCKIKGIMQPAPKIPFTVQPPMKIKQEDEALKRKTQGQRVEDRHTPPKQLRLSATEEDDDDDTPVVTKGAREPIEISDEENETSSTSSESTYESDEGKSKSSRTTSVSYTVSDDDNNISVAMEKARKLTDISDEEDENSSTSNESTDDSSKSAPRKNSTTSKPVVLAGKLDKDSHCESGANYDDPYGTFTDVLVTGYVSIGIYDYDIKLNLENDKVFMQDGTPCNAKARHCISGEGGNVFWDTLPEQICGANKYTVLYEGFITKVSDLEDKNVMYSLDTKDFSFALLKTYEETICGITFIKTEIPRFLIIENPRSNHLVRKQEVAAANVDIFAFINAEALFLEKHLKKQMKEMYETLVLQRCKLERKVIENALAIATLQPSELAYQIPGERGVMAVPRGESLYFVTCLRVNLELRTTDDCYNEIPVQHGNETLFLAPRSRILIAHGKKITCDTRMPPMFKMGNIWYRMMPRMIDAPAPTIIEPQSQTNWKYATTDALATGGVYSEKDQKKYRDLIVFPLERPAVLNQVAMTVSGRYSNKEGINIAGFLDEAMLEKIANNTWSRIYSSFLNFGTVSAGIIGLIMLIRLIKLCIDATIRSYVLYEIFGFSFKLFGAMMASVTALLIHKDARREKSEDIEQQVADETTPSAPESQVTRANLYPNLDRASI